MSLPVFFIVLSTAALLFALGSLFTSLRAAFGGAGQEPLTAGPGLPDRAALEDEKNSLLRALKDLEYEHEVGKIADADYERLERAYRARAKTVLADLDRDLGPYLSQAEELVARTLSGAKGAETAAAGRKPKKKARAGEHAATGGPAEVTREPAESSEAAPAATTSSDATDDAMADEASAPPSLAPATKVCGKCETSNDPDALFCKRCAAPLDAAGAEAKS